MSKETYAKMKNLLEKIVQKLEKEESYLNHLDANIGDGDHGRTIATSFRKTLEELSPEKDLDIGAFLKKVGGSIAFSGGAATGPLFGTAFIEAGKALEGKEALSLENWAKALESAEEGIKKRGNAKVGEKTMLDAIHPAVQSLKKSFSCSESLNEALEKVRQSAQKGMESTKNLISKRGRSSRLGERTKGHIDPGAASSYFILETVIEACRKGKEKQRA